MKKLTLFTIVLIAITINIYAQIPNSGFENWNTVGDHENPSGWRSSNLFCSGSFHPCTKSTDHFPASVGNYSIRLESNTSLSNCGSGDATTLSSNGMPFFLISGHPNSLCGYYKFNSMNNDSMLIFISFFYNGSLAGKNKFVTNTSTFTWTPFILPLTYVSADSATISLQTFSAIFPVGNSVLCVDNLSFDNLVSSDTEWASERTFFDIYPNPASELATLNIYKTGSQNMTLNIYNIMGKLISSESIQQNQYEINTDDLSNGVYLVEIKTIDWTQKQKLVIQRQ